MRSTGWVVAVVVAMGCGGGGADQPDATPGIDASQVDGRPVDSSLDGPPAGPLAFLGVPYSLGVVPANQSTATQIVVVQNVSGATLHSVSASGDATLTASAPAECQELVAGASCELVVSAKPAALGAYSGTLTITSDGATQTASVDGTAEAALDVTVDTSAGSGTVQILPASTACDGHCYPGGSIITLVAQPAADTTVAWSLASCGTATSCVVTLGADPTAITAQFLHGVVALEIDIAAPTGVIGDIVVDKSDGTSTTCSASCTVLVDDRFSAVLSAETPARFVGYTDCPTSPETALCSVAAGAGAHVTATFAGDRNERDLFVDTTVFSVDFTAAGNLVIGTDTQVEELDSTFALVWTAAFAGPAHVAPDGSVLVQTTTQLVKLSAAGAVVWKHAQTATLPGDAALGHRFAATASDGIVVDTGTSLEILDASGAAVATPALPSGDRGAIAVGSNGTIAAIVAHGAGDSDDIAQFSATGSALAPLESAFADPTVAIAADGTGGWAVSSVDEDHLQLFRLTSTGASTQLRNTSVDDPIPRSAAVAAFAGTVAMACSSDAISSVTGLDLSEYAVDTSLTWEVLRPTRDTTIGIDLHDTASSSASVAIAGSYFGELRAHGVVVLYDR